jgi:hypothetical protein
VPFNKNWAAAAAHEAGHAGFRIRLGAAWRFESIAVFARSHGRVHGLVQVPSDSRRPSSDSLPYAATCLAGPCAEAVYSRLPLCLVIERHARDDEQMAREALARVGRDDEETLDRLQEFLIKWAQADWALIERIADALLWTRRCPRNRRWERHELTYGEVLDWVSPLPALPALGSMVTSLLPELPALLSSGT